MELGKNYDLQRCASVETGNIVGNVGGSDGRGAPVGGTIQHESCGDGAGCVKTSKVVCGGRCMGSVES